MKKSLLIMVLLCAGIANAQYGSILIETDPVWLAERADYATGTPVYVESDPVWLSEKAGYATIAGTPTDLVVTGNNQTLTVTAAQYNTFGQGKADGFTNELSLAAPGAGGRIVTFIGGFVNNTNRVTFEDGGVTRIPSGLAVGLARDDSAVFTSVDVSTWVCTSYIINSD